MAWLCDEMRFKCKSTLPSDLCCLYTQTCEGDSDPLSAALTDDGLELVAARKSTADMQQFLKRLELRASQPHSRHSQPF